MPSWNLPVNDSNIYVKRRTIIAFVISLAIHAGALLYLSSKKTVVATSVANMAPKIMSVSIAGLRSPHISTKSHKKILVRKPRVELKKNTSMSSRIVAKDKPIIESLHQVPLSVDNNAPADLMSYIKVKRQQAQELEDSAIFENAATQGPSEEEKRDAIIKRNLQQKGASGVFEIRRMSLRTGQFSFRGWKNNYDNSRLELIDVTAGSDDNLELATVKKMIEIIRREYRGDFRWESQRLGRVLVLSARIEDNAELESFLMKEFFLLQNYYPRY